MNKRLIVYILGWVLIVEGAAMQIATVTSFIYGEHEGLYFLGVGALSALLGLLAVKSRALSEGRLCGYCVKLDSYVFCRMFSVLAER
mgnify:CR=1 FL=1